MKNTNTLTQYKRHNCILERLNNGELLSIAELSREWDIPTKTLQRDFKKLMEGSYGVVRAEDGKKFKVTKKRTTSADTTTALHLLESLSKDIGGEFYRKAHTALHSIQTHFDSPFYTRIDVEDISTHQSIISTLEQAIAEHKMVSFNYKPWYKESKHHTNVKPYKIIIFDGFVYLFCQLGNYYPKFYIKGISNLSFLNESFDYNEKLLASVEKAQNIWFDPSKEPFEVILYLSPTATVYFERKPIKDQRLKVYDDGTSELKAYMTNKEEVFTILKRWIPHIKVAEPENLQDEFENILDEYLQLQPCE